MRAGCAEGRTYSFLKPWSVPLFSYSISVRKFEVQILPSLAMTNSYLNLPVADRGLVTSFLHLSLPLRGNPEPPGAGTVYCLNHRGSAPEPVTFLGRARKVTKRDPPLVSRACAFPVLLDEFGVCGTRSKNEKTHKGCELRQVLDHSTELACVTRRLTRGPERHQWGDACNGVFG